MIRQRELDLVESCVIGTRKMFGQILLVRRQDMDGKMLGFEIRSERVAGFGDAPQHQRRLQGYRCKAVGRDAAGRPVAVRAGNDRNTGRKLPEVLPELDVLVRIVHRGGSMRTRNRAGKKKPRHVFSSGVEPVGAGQGGALALRLEPVRRDDRRAPCRQQVAVAGDDVADHGVSSQQPNCSRFRQPRPAGREPGCPFVVSGMSRSQE